VDKLNILTGNITLKLDDGKLVVVKKVEITGEAAPAEEPQQRNESPAATGRSSQKNRDRQRERPQAAAPTGLEESKPVAPKPGPPAEASPQRDGQPKPARKKHRTRKPGQRKPSRNVVPEGDPTGTPKE